METFYSVVSISPNPNAGDSLSIGLIAMSNHSFWVRFSDRKIKAVRRLTQLPNDLLGWVITQIESTFEGDKRPVFTKGMPNLELELESPYTQDYFAYLNTYTNGLLRFGEPKKLNVKLDKEGFSKLFKVFVDPHEEATTGSEVALDAQIRQKNKERFKLTVREKLIDPLRDQVNTNFDISDAKKTLNIPVFFNLKLDCFGKNGKFLAAKAFDFQEVGYETLNMHVSHYSYLIAHLNSMVNKQNLYYCIADEPEVGTDKHRMWVALKDSKLFDVVPLEETDKVTQIIQESKAKKVVV